jgi:hypothetical protein
MKRRRRRCIVRNSAGFQFKSDKARARHICKTFHDVGDVDAIDGGDLLAGLSGNVIWFGFVVVFRL